ncbi:MAG: twin-arginine translocase subunit TatB [Gammaproteobacteria bacterium]|nr:twin-arginine translocase subunit TatB [Gammaproteobacteria bacterium]
MFDIGFLELALIAVLALIILGPERLPGAARSVGRFTAKARNLARGLQAQFRAEIEREENRLKEETGLGQASESESVRDERPNT